MNDITFESGNLIFDNLERYADNIALIDEDGKKISYLQMIDEADRMTENLEPRNLIFILCKNHTSAIIGYVGSLRRRIVPLLLRADIQEEIFYELIEIYRPRYIWSEANRKFSQFKEIYTDGFFMLFEKTNTPPLVVQ